MTDTLARTCPTCGTEVVHKRRYLNRDGYWCPCCDGWVRLVLAGADRMDDRVDAWHEGDGDGQSLHEYLGLTWDQYAHWVKTGSVPS